MIDAAVDVYAEPRKWRRVRAALGVPDILSIAQWVALDENRKTALTSAVDARSLAALKSCWWFWARGRQYPPEDDSWDVLTVSAGRGAGKTVMGSELVNLWANTIPNSYILLVGRTAAEVRDIQVMSQSGILERSRVSGWPVPEYQVAQSRLVWKHNGSLAYTFSAEQPDELRGRNATAAWLDEMSSFTKDAEVFDVLMKCMRVGPRPQVLVTTTPKSGTKVKQLMDWSDDWLEAHGMLPPETAEFRHRMRGGRDVILPSLHCVSVVASSYENISNLSGSYLNVLKAYEGTSDAQSEIYGIVPTSDPDALWQPEYITHVRPDEVEPFRAIAVGVDPAGVTTGECGIVLAGLNDAGTRCYVFGDLTCSGDPAVWSRRAIEAYVHCGPQTGVYLIVEKNYGGGQARLVLENAAHDMGVSPVIVEVEARQSKLGRAHPVSLLYQQEKVVHVGVFPQLETELCTYTGAQNQRSPNRMDSMVHAVGHLMLSGIKIYRRDFNLY